MSAITQLRTHRILATIATAGGGLVLLFWIFYFAGVIQLGDAGSPLAQFESAFPLADALLAVALLAGGFGLFQRKRYGLFFLIGGAFMTLYLGILDLTFYARQGFFFPLTPDVAVSMLVIVLCLTGGTLGLLLGWKVWSKG